MKDGSKNSGMLVTVGMLGERQVSLDANFSVAEYVQANCLCTPMNLVDKCCIYKYVQKTRGIDTICAL